MLGQILDKNKDYRIVSSYNRGREDYQTDGFSADCPFEPESLEAQYWTMGFNEAVKNELSDSWEI